MTSETFRPPQFTGFGSSGNVQTSVWTLSVSAGFTLTLVLQSSAAVEALPSDCYLTNVLSDFGNTLSFATDPVFGLPDGYSANSADAGILGNLYAMPVPEPACGALAALGLLIVAGRASRWRLQLRCCRCWRCHLRRKGAVVFRLVATIFYMRRCSRLPTPTVALLTAPSPPPRNDIRDALTARSLPAPSCGTVTPRLGVAACRVVA